MDLFFRLISLILNSVYSFPALSVVPMSRHDVLVRSRGNQVDEAGIILQRQFGIRGKLTSVKS